MLHRRSPACGGWSRHLPALSLVALLTGCMAVRLPEPPAPVAGVAPLPLRVGLCPAADSSARWLVTTGLFAQVEPLRADAAMEPVDLVVVDMSSRVVDGWQAGTSAADVLAIVTLGVLPKLVTHRGEAQVTFRRAGEVAAACAPVPAGSSATDVLTVQVTPKARELVAFWLFVPALVAALPGWEFQGGEAARRRVEPIPWLAAELERRRPDLLRLAGR